jgi:hypothetical protein
MVGAAPARGVNVLPPHRRQHSGPIAQKVAAHGWKHILPVECLHHPCQLLRWAGCARRQVVQTYTHGTVYVQVKGEGDRIDAQA